MTYTFVGTFSGIPADYHSGECRELSGGVAYVWAVAPTPWAREDTYAPIFTNGWARCTVSRRKANKKPPNCADHHESTH